MKISWLRYVPLNKVDEYLERGYKLVDDLCDCHHGVYAVIMEWAGDGEPK